MKLFKTFLLLSSSILYISVAFGINTYCPSIINCGDANLKHCKFSNDSTMKLTFYKKVPSNYSLSTGVYTFNQAQELKYVPYLDLCIYQQNRLFLIYKTSGLKAKIDVSGTHWSRDNDGYLCNAASPEGCEFNNK